MDDIPTVRILLLGDAEVGKSTFLSRLSLGSVVPPALAAVAPGLAGPSSSKSDEPPPYEMTQLRDMDQPFIFNISMYNRPYRFEFYDTASPTSYRLLRPNFIILAFDITNRGSLFSLRQRWKYETEVHFNYDESMPVMVLGLKRDLRRDEPEFVMPQEALSVAQAMRCDRYAECSALTGELCKEVLEDIARTAALTTTDKGGRSEGGCHVM